MTEKNLQREPRLFRGDYSDMQLISWLNKLVLALEMPEQLEKAAAQQQQSLNQTQEKLAELNMMREKSICNEVQDPIQHQ
ncbi:hypothetical protein [Candidatus Pantoea floridensis]|uniref:Uncharacterized protein n=1 Tax=Candidatus Pantoea floridensis TaxID=1938870 RepID=A0A286BTV3_9GAMM|nr:hypothetical protein [Pantoea floridensis]PIF24129.1 hypothetical protein BX596_3620 [Enterobacteriaceae bacterium JKS000233]SOD37582.1 hypothetical protein SAMN06273570_1942 [Pantoea floridensis]